MPHPAHQLILSADRTILFVPVAKSGSSSVLEAMEQARTSCTPDQFGNYPHITELNEGDPVPDSVRACFVVVRDPVARLASAFAMRVTGGLGYWEPAPGMQLREFIDWTEAELHDGDPDPHVRPQHWAIGCLLNGADPVITQSGRQVPVTLVPIERLSFHLERLGLPSVRENAIGGQPVDPALAAEIAELYPEDLALHAHALSTYTYP